MSEGSGSLMEIKIPSRCYCGEPLTDLGRIAHKFINVNSLRRFICKDCGRCIDIVDYVLDDEDLDKALKASEAQQPSGG